MDGKILHDWACVGVGDENPALVKAALIGAAKGVAVNVTIGSGHLYFAELSPSSKPVTDIW